MKDINKLTRRSFIKKAAGASAALAFPSIVPATVFGQNGKAAPSDQVTMACIGVGWQGTTNLENFLDLSDVRILAVCDIDKSHMANAKRIVDGKYGNTDCKTFHDYQEIMARSDIDTVSLGLPDHWHAIPAITAAKSGKDVFGEKPFSHSLAEGRAMINALERYGRVWQTGSWQRSQGNFRFGCELVRNGRIGKVHTVEVNLPSGHADFANTKDQRDFIAPPPELDYDTWLGPAPYAPYAVCRVHKNWRWNYDYGGGQLMDWIGHHGDIALWGLDLERTGPVEISCDGDIVQGDEIWNTAQRYRGIAKYANGVKMILGGGHKDIADGQGGTKWIGDLGWIAVGRGGRIEAEPRTLLREVIGANETHLLESPGHWRNFIDCVKSRSEPIASAEVAHRSASVGHVALISMKLHGRTLKFDPDKEIFANDEEANLLLSRPYRAPWKLA